jgi:sulfate/thiosulfate transport system substrate-binding protein
MKAFAVALLSALTLAVPARAQDANTLLNASYDIGRELFAAVNVEFVKAYKAQTGKDVTINQSHAGTSKQARAILEGLEADVVTFNQSTDIDLLAKGGAVSKDWPKAFPHNASPFYSLPAFVVRKGNPKNIKNWGDLARDDVQPIFPNPKTSGNARYTYLAAYAWALEEYKGDTAKADEYIKKMLSNVPVFDTGGRASTTTFVERETGDVLISFEAETAAVIKQYGSDKFEVVVPPVSLLAEFPVAVVDKYAEKHGTQELAKAYLEYLYTPAGQEIIAGFHNRVRDEAVAEKHKADFPQVRLLTVENVFGGWEKAQKEHFASGAKLDQVFVAK